LANALQPGDELILHGGTYTQTCRRAITVVGTALNPITIRAADGESPVLTRPGDPTQGFPQNNIEIIDSAYVAIRGLTFQSGDIGVRFINGHHITFENNEVFNTSNNAVTLNSGNTNDFNIRLNHIHHTGLLDISLGTTEGEGMYVGCNGATCVASGHLIENNYIHDLRGTSGGGNDGIEVKVGSHGNTIKDNVIHNTTIGTRYPCIFVYGGGPAQNVVQGNALWNCGEAIQVVSDALVTDNLILNSDVGITAAPHAQVASMKDVTIAHNTIYGHGECLYVRWAGTSNMQLANNAVYCPGTSAVDASGLAGAEVKNNFVEGGLAGVSIDNQGFFNGGSASSAFASPAALDFWPQPGSPLIEAGDPGHGTPVDFNATVRDGPYDVGAYETDGLDANPGWQVGPGFKGFPPLVYPPVSYLPIIVAGD
ncbi:MAG: right-handed parallel beta-helix repeat-containing protein, partial [Anaerolineales bacterium]|nr:right-handed parallel beta-helix repeat-containing protein [Anaerolineales bacterium]